MANILQSLSSLNTASNGSNTVATASGSLGARPGRTSESISSSASTISRQGIRRQHENWATEGEALFSLGGNGNNFSINRGTVIDRDE